MSTAIDLTCRIHTKQRRLNFIALSGLVLNKSFASDHSNISVRFL